MTFQEANKDSRELFCRNNLTYDTTVSRLKKYFSGDEVQDIMGWATSVVSWTNGRIAVLCTDKVARKYSIVASGIYMELIEP
ncbi:MAG: hypothetical protein IJT36_03270 [Alphaproteobacteria bacterium]|nr:hypothetical protein [Alphaproteobacteria bacterium]